jgi:hypothetical protein
VNYEGVVCFMKSSFNVVLMIGSIASSLLLADTSVSVAEDNGTEEEGTLSWAIEQVNTAEGAGIISICSGINPTLTADMPDITVDLTIKSSDQTNTIYGNGHKVISVASGTTTISSGVFLKDSLVSLVYNTNLIFEGGQSDPVSISCDESGAGLIFNLKDEEVFNGVYEGSFGRFTIDGGTVNLSGFMQTVDLMVKEGAFNFSGNVTNGSISVPSGGKGNQTFSGDLVGVSLELYSGTTLLSGKNILYGLSSGVSSTAKVSSIDNLFGDADRSGLLFLQGGGGLQITGDCFFRSNDDVHFYTGYYCDTLNPRTFVLDVEEGKTLMIPKVVVSRSSPYDHKVQHPFSEASKANDCSAGQVFDLCLQGAGTFIVPVFEACYGPDEVDLPELHVKGSLGGTSGFTLSGSGYLSMFFESENAFTGPTCIGTNNKLVVVSGASFGTATDKITIDSNATLIVDGSVLASEIENHGTLSGTGTINGVPVAEYEVKSVPINNK